MTRKQESAIAALLSEGTLEQAAEKAGISLATIKRWLQVPEFAAALRQARADVRVTAVGHLAASSVHAVLVLRGLLTSGSEKIRMQAAVHLLTIGVKYREIEDMAAELAHLRRQVEEMVSPAPKPYAPRGRGGAA